jgi:hypothetical protein
VSRAPAQLAGVWEQHTCLGWLQGTLSSLCPHPGQEARGTPDHEARLEGTHSTPRPCRQTPEARALMAEDLATCVKRKWLEGFLADAVLSSPF